MKKQKVKALEMPELNLSGAYLISCERARQLNVEEFSAGREIDIDYKKRMPKDPLMERLNPAQLCHKVKLAAKAVLRSDWPKMAIGMVVPMYYKDRSDLDVSHVCFWLYSHGGCFLQPAKMQYVKIHAKRVEMWTGKTLRDAIFKIMRGFKQKIVTGKK